MTEKKDKKEAGLFVAVLEYKEDDVLMKCGRIRDAKKYIRERTDAGKAYAIVTVHHVLARKVEQVEKNTLEVVA